MKKSIILLLIKGWWWIGFAIYCTAQADVSGHEGSVDRAQLPIEATIENTFIFHLATEHRDEAISYSEQERNVEDCKAKFQKIMEANRIPFNFIHSFWHGFEGFSIALGNPSNIRLIENLNLDLFSEILFDRVLEGHNLDVHGEDLYTDKSVIQIPFEFMDVPRGEYYKGGDGVGVVVIDQGIRYTEKPFIVPGQVCNKLKDEGCRVKEILDFVDFERKRKNSKKASEAKLGYDIKNDVYGDHGTVIASLIGGTAELAPGISQKVSFYDFRCFEEGNTSPFSRILLALNHAIQYDIDIINMSLGGFVSDSLGLQKYYSKCRSKGILLTISAGNEGESKLPFQLGSLANSRDAITVGSFRNPIYSIYRLQLQWHMKDCVQFHEEVKFFSLVESNFDTFVGTSECVFSLNEWNIRTYQYSKTYLLVQSLFILLECDSPKHCLTLVNLIKKDPKIIGVVFVLKMKLAKSMFESIFIPLGYIYEIPVNFYRTMKTMSHATAEFIYETAFFSDYLPSPSSISSMGPSYLFTIKPDISTIGCAIRSYRGKEKDTLSYCITDGTSNSNAILTGALSLDIAYHKSKGWKVDIEDVLTRLQNTARPVLYSSDQIEMTYSNSQFLAYPVFKQGAGLVQIESMIQTLVKIYPSKMELGDIQSNNKDLALFHSVTLEFINSGREDVQYYVEHVPALSTKYSVHREQYIAHGQYLHVEILNDNQNEMIKPIILVPKEAKLDLPLWFQLPTITNMTNPMELTFFNGYFQFTPIDIVFQDSNPLFIPQERGPEYPRLSVPYLSLYGDLNSLPVLVTKGQRAAFLTNLEIMICHESLNRNYPLRDLPLHPSFPIYTSAVWNAKFTFRGLDKPVVSLCLLFPLKALSFELFTYLSDRELGSIQKYKNLPPRCILFFLQDALSYSYFKPLKSKENLRSRGWDGTYRSLPNSKPRKITCGEYRICAKFERQSDVSSFHEREWCSAHFTVTGNC